MKWNQFLLIVLYLLSFWIFVGIFILFWGFGLISFGFLNSLATFLLPILCAFGHSISFLTFWTSFFLSFRRPFMWICSWTFFIFFSPTATHNRFFPGLFFFFRGTLKIQGLKLKLDLTEMSSVSFWLFLFALSSLYLIQGRREEEASSLNVKQVFLWEGFYPLFIL